MTLKEKMSEWGSKSNTNSYDLAAVILYFVYKCCEGGRNIEDFDEYLNALRPEAGWREEWGGKRRIFGTIRDSMDYGKEFLL